MNKEFNESYKALLTAALGLSAEMLATLPQEQIDAVAARAGQGAKLDVLIKLRSFVTKNPRCVSIAHIERKVNPTGLFKCSHDSAPNGKARI